MATEARTIFPGGSPAIYTAAITDVMDEMGLLRQTLPHTIQPLTPDMRLAGYALHRLRPHRIAASRASATPPLRRFLGMIGAVPPDSVLVLAANDNEAAHFGELSAGVVPRPEGARRRHRRQHARRRSTSRACASPPSCATARRKTRCRAGG